MLKHVKVLGIDQSVRHTGVCVLSYDGTNVSTEKLVLIEPPKQLKDAAALAHTKAALEAILNMYIPIDYACLEGYSFSSINKKFALGEVGGLIKLSLLENSISFKTVAPKQVKKFIANNGNAEKQDVINSIFMRYKVYTTNDNLADAYSLARVALGLVAPETASMRCEKEVLKSLTTVAVKTPKKKLPKLDAL